MRMALLFRSAEKLGVDPGPLFSRAAEIASCLAVKDQMRNFLLRRREDRDFRRFFIRECVTRRIPLRTAVTADERLIWREKLRR